MPSTHIWYDTAETRSKNVTAFECQLTVPTGKDPLHTYYMACGFSGGYLGMQVNGPQERRILFSVWDDGKGSKVDTVAANPKALVEPFGGEGDGMHAILWHDWVTGQTYNFRVTARAEPETMSTVYSGLILLDDEWTLVAAFRRPSDGRHLRGLYSFLENFGPCIQDERKCLYGNVVVQFEGSDQEHPIHSCKCTTTEEQPNNDFYAFGLEQSCFAMTINGPNALLNQRCVRPESLSL